MATIYRFIVEEGKSGRSGGKREGENSRKKTGKTKTLLNLLGSGEKGGVEHNRKLRAINPLLNRATGGQWEKGMRLGRAGLGLVKFREVDGTMKFAGLSGTAVAIIIAFALQTAMKHHQKLIDKTDKENKANYKKMELGVGAIRGEYSVASNVWSGKITYNQNR